MTAFGYPVALHLADRRVLVVGREAVAMGKVEGLLAGGATEVVIVAEGPTRRLAKLETDPRVIVARRELRSEDLDGAFVLVASAGDPGRRDQIARDARDRGVLVNMVDDVPNCDFAAPALVRRGELAIAISTGGRIPALARRLREELSERFGPEWEDAARVLGEVREATLPELPDFSQRARRWQAALDLDEVEQLARAGRLEELRALVLARLLAPGEESVA